MLKKLKNLKKKWRARATKEYKMAQRLFDKRAVASGEKSVGISIGYDMAAEDLRRIIDEYSNLPVTLTEKQRIPKEIFDD